jgi:adenylate cyclase
LAIEIERKFLIPKPPEWLDEHPSAGIEQGYLAVAGQEQVRVRRSDGNAVLTVKRGEGERRVEVEVEITREQLDALWPLTEGRRVSKVRYRIPNEETIEVDVYTEALEGLVVAEVEFDSEPRAGQFDPPPWFGKELTGDHRYGNDALATDGLPPDHTG